MVERVARQRQAEPLDGVGEDDDRRVRDGVGFGQHFEQARQVVSGRGWRRPAAGPHRRSPATDEQDRLRLGRIGHVGQAAAQLRAVAQADQRLVLLVAHLVDAPAQRVATRFAHRRFQPGAVLRLEDLPAGAGEERLQPRRAHAGDDPVETLPVEVDDPDDVAQPLDRLLGDRFPDIPLVQLGVADERDEAV